MNIKFMHDAITAIAHRMEKEKDYLTDLDNAIADGDHGINMARGFQSVLEQMPNWEDKDIEGFLKSVGMQLVSTVGGASGPLYGTMFLKFAATCKGKEEITAEDFAAGLAAGIEGVKSRGKSQESDKTMLDALCPAHRALTKGLAAGKDAKAAFESAVIAAEKGVEYTKEIIAIKGRASYIGERSIGHQDPGATSSWFMLQEIAKLL